MDMVEYGRRVQLARELLKMTQKEFAEAINTRQTLISRLEKGFGGTCQNIFNILSLLNSKGYIGKNIFNEPFKVEMLTKKNAGTLSFKKALKSVAEIKESLHENYEKLVLVHNLFEEQVSS
jgi:transcriptional regulator with XRE-family HTH domain